MHLFNKLFTIWAIAGTAAAYYNPSMFTGLKPYIVPGLALIMFGMGITLSWNSFSEVLKKPAVVFLGVILQFAVMPLAAFGISKLLGLSTAQTVGMVLVGSCPGGTASNVICYLAKANVALSITMTSVSTILAVFATPFLTYFYVNHAVDVPIVNMLISVFKIVIMPVLLGAVINTFFSKRIRVLKEVFPSVSVIIIVLIIATVVALNKNNIAGVSSILMLAVVLHNSTGLILGYSIPRMLGYPKDICRTVSIEVGMQNSGLSVALATKHFTNMVVATLPGAIFSVWHNISGSLLASFWNMKDGEKSGNSESLF